MRRYSAPGTLSYSFGPGPMSFAVKVLIWTNGVAFLFTWFVPRTIGYLGLSPYLVIDHFWLWQPVTYMFLHAGIWHIVWNMLALWMFGVELERLWGTRFFVKFYLACGLAGAALTLALSVLPLPVSAPMFGATTIGASGAILGLLLAYGMYFPDRPIYMYFLFAIPAKYFVMIIGGITLLMTFSGGGGIAWAAHLGGLAGGYLFLKFGRARPLAEFKYRYFRWKMNRLRRRFDVHDGGRTHKDWDHRVH
jgi:membrane associated rhomboid family serine protease